MVDRDNCGLLLSLIGSLILGYVIGLKSQVFATRISISSNDYGNTINLLSIDNLIKNGDVEKALKITNEAFEAQIKLMSYTRDSYFFLSDQQRIEFDLLLAQFYKIEAGEGL